MLMSLSMMFLLSVSVCIGQTINETASTTDKTEVKCTPSPECAAKMGMTLEECKALCLKATAECKAKCTKETSVESGESSVDAIKVAAASVSSEATIDDAHTSKEKVCVRGSKKCCKKKS